MSTSTFVNSYAITVTHVTAKILLTLKEIIRDIGLDPSKLAKDWETYEEAVSTWIASGHFKRITLEVYHPCTYGLVRRWDMDVSYSTVGDGQRWVDTAAVRYAIAKAGLAPADCLYDIIVTTAPDRPKVDGWGPCELRSTEGFKRYSVGATVGGNGLHAQTAYWSR